MEPVTSPSAADKKTTNAFSRFFQDPRKRGAFITVMVVVLLFAGILIWKAIQIDRLKKSAAADKSRLTQQAQQAIEQTHQRHLLLLVKPYAWAVRTEMMRGNLEGVNEYANEMIREKNIQSITVADGKGLIVSSTNKKFEGKPFTALGKQSYLASDTAIVEKSGDHTLVASSPIMGLTDRLGTLLILYALPQPFPSDSAGHP